MKRASKAYKNIDFLKSREARTIRILSEYVEPEKRFKEQNLKHTVVFFGSARIDPKKDNIKGRNKYFEAAEEFAFLLSEYSAELKKKGDTFAICTGGGPGIMEAANMGAKRGKAHSVGLNIALPHEQFPNNFIDDEFNFEFNYFFMRKFWFLYLAKALICFPGGFGTLDELFETLTLIQTGKFEKDMMPVMLYDKEYWNDLINFDKLVDYGLISPEDMNLIHFFDSPKEGMEYLKPRLQKVIEDFNSHQI